MNLNRQYKGTFLVLEGIDGSGKTTQCGKIAEFFESHGVDHLITREPGGTHLAEGIRHLALTPTEEEVYPKTELFLMMAARVQHINNVIIPALKEGKVVVCDRFTASSFAYQVRGGQLDPLDFVEVSNIALDGLHSDITFYYNVGPEVSLKRIESRGDLNRLDSLDLERMKTLSSAYSEFWGTEGGKWLWVDADQSEDHVFASTLPVLMQIVNHHKLRPSHH